MEWLVANQSMKFVELQLIILKHPSISLFPQRPNDQTQTKQPPFVVKAWYPNLKMRLNGTRKFHFWASISIIFSVFQTHDTSTKGILMYHHLHEKAAERIPLFHAPRFFTVPCSIITARKSDKMQLIFCNVRKTHSIWISSILWKSRSRSPQKHFLHKHYTNVPQ